MSVCYKKLLHLLIDEGISNSDLLERAQISANIITRMKRNRYISLESIEKICCALDCCVDDILEFNDDAKDAK